MCVLCLIIEKMMSSLQITDDVVSNQSKCSNSGDHVEFENAPQHQLEVRESPNKLRRFINRYCTSTHRQLMIGEIIFQSKSSDQKSAHRCVVNSQVQTLKVVFEYF